MCPLVFKKTLVLYLNPPFKRNISFKTLQQECLLDESKETWFQKKEAVKIVKEFKSDLKEIDGIFKKMKKFQHLRPANVYKGVAV